MKNKNITGVVLAGGKSSRMGTDKSLLLINNRTFIGHIIEALKPCVNDIIIIANSDIHKNSGYKIYKDIIADHGPLGGIYTALTYSSTQDNLIISCDMPFINNALLKYLILSSTDVQVNALTNNGNIEPLCATYDKNCLPIIKTCLKNNFLKMKNVLRQLTVNEIEINNQLFYHPSLISNINTPIELNQATKAMFLQY